MPADVQSHFFDRFQVEAILIYIGGAILILGWSLFANYTPGWNWNAGPSALWFIVGVIVLFGGLATWGVAQGFRHHTRKFIAQNRMFQLAYPNPVTIETNLTTIDERALVGLSSKEREEAATASERMAESGGGKPSRSLTVRMYLPGGIDAHGFKSFAGGSQGMIICDGDDQIIELDQGLFSPHDLVPLDHTQVPINVLTEAERQSHFTRGVTPIFRTGPLSKGPLKWLRTSAVPQSVVLQAIGYDGLVDRAIARLHALTTSGRLPSLAANGKRVSPDALKVLREELGKWLRSQEPLRMAMNYDSADVETYKQKYFGLLSQNTLNEAIIRRQEHALYDAKDAIAGRFAHEAKVWGRGGGHPADDLRANRPAMSTQE